MPRGSCNISLYLRHPGIAKLPDGAAKVDCFERDKTGKQIPLKTKFCITFGDSTYVVRPLDRMSRQDGTLKVILGLIEAGFCPYTLEISQFNNELVGTAVAKASNQLKCLCESTRVEGDLPLALPSEIRSLVADDQGRIEIAVCETRGKERKETEQQA